MAKLLIPEEGNYRVRNFDEIVVFDRKGRMRSRRRVSGTWVLSRSGKSRKLTHLDTQRTRRPAPLWFWPAFWLMEGVVLTLTVNRFLMP